MMGRHYGFVLSAHFLSMKKIIAGGQIKVLSDSGKIGGYAIRFGSESDTDLVGDFFTPDTFFGNTTGNLPVYYHHGQDPDIGLKAIGQTTDIKVDSVGIWMDAQLDLRDEYEQAIFELAKQGKLGYSTGSASHVVSSEKSGNAYKITSWPLVEVSVTPTPAEFRNNISAKSQPVPVKGLLDGESYNQFLGRVSRAFALAYPEQEDLYMWVVDVWDSYAIINRFGSGIGGDFYYRVGYVQDGGKILVDMESSVKVEREVSWVESDHPQKAIYLKEQESNAIWQSLHKTINLKTA